MTPTQIKNRKKITFGNSLPIFLLMASLALGFVPNISAASQSERKIRIVFKADQAAVGELSADYKLAAVSPVFSDTSDRELRKVYSTQVSDSDYGKLAADPAVEYAQLDGQVAAAEIIPNDQYFTAKANAEDKQWYLPQIKMPQAWEFGTGSGNVTVAVIDTGIHASHVELNDGRVIAGYNVVDHVNIPAAADSDDNGHGTAVSGIIGAIGNNRLGIAGINWKIKLMPIKALSADGTGGVSAISAGIVWAADHGANVINLSLGGGGFGSDQTFNEAVRYAYGKNVLIVAAAGNDLVENGQNLDEKPVYPVCADNGQNMILGVAATDVDDHKTSF
jgi:thermitase